MNIKAAALAAMFSMAVVSSLSAADVALEFGKGSGKVGYINQNTNPGEEVYEIGPRSFRVINNSIWVLDTVGNKLLSLAFDGKLLEEITFGKPDEKILAEDFAPVMTMGGQIDSFWVINGYKSTVFKLSKDGSIADELSSDELMQPMRIEIDQELNLCVSDDAAQKIFVFSPAKQLVAQIPYEWSGLFPSSDKGLFCLKHNAAEKRTELVKMTSSGKETQKMPLMLEKHFNSHLWWVNEKEQEVFLTFASAVSKDRIVTLARCGFDGSLKGLTTLTIPRNMTRFIDCSNGEAWIGDADYTEAPSGKLQFKKIVMP